jgi:hypothetical protein
MLASAEFYLARPYEIILVGEKESPDTRALFRTLYRRFVPNRVIMLVDSPQSRTALAGGIPSIASMSPLDGRASAYVCQNYTCQLPVCEAGKLAELIQ